MGFIDDLLRGLGLPVVKRRKRSSGSISLPDPNEIKEKIEKAVDNLSQIKDLPKSIMNRAIEAEGDFREADRAFRGSRPRKRK